MNRCLHLLLLAALFGGLATTEAFAQGSPGEREVDRSIVRALKFLAAQQQPSGAWQLKNASRGRDAASATSLAVMAFMAAGHVPGEGPYGDAMERGIRWVLSNQRPNDGLFQHRAGSGPMYTHGICTLMLAEVAGMVDASLSDRVRKSLEKAILLILKAQDVPKGNQHAGGWRYDASSHDSDLSVTGWQLLALRAAKNIGCDVPAEAIEYAVSYVNKCADRNGGFSYQAGHGVSPTRTGTGILCLEICGEHHAPATMAGADYLLRRPLRYNDSFFFYGVYYSTVGMFQVGGRHWEQTRNNVTTLLLTRQHPDGSWNPTDGSEASFGPVYATSMSVLALAVEYQYLPIYQR
ncbi:MAG: terpene cyclase/mutase family protein [Planctomycetota bacterium]|nr:terpene cyclase/mutase family protein [Planctomycetota bacterium]